MEETVRAAAAAAGVEGAEVEAWGQMERCLKAQHRREEVPYLLEAMEEMGAAAAVVVSLQQALQMEWTDKLEAAAMAVEAEGVLALGLLIRLILYKADREGLAAGAAAEESINPV